jgi:ppGpp synthetase/RelA/SpoT-type nucleotidyltranferase
MTEPNDVSVFLDAYREYISTTVRPSSNAVSRELRSWRAEDYWKRYAHRGSPALPTPIQHTQVRIKRPESVIDKIRRLPAKFPLGVTPESLYSMRDLLGARVVTFFQAHLRMIGEEIRTGGQFELAPEWKPRSYMPEEMLDAIGLDVDSFQVHGKKPSGYASLHYVVRLRTQTTGPWFELQVRTMVEQVWGEVEHQLAYKPDQPMDLDARNQFWILSQYLDTIDLHFNLLYHHSLNRQSESDPKLEDDLTPDNLPKVIEHLGYAIAQREISGLFEILQLSGITLVRQLWNRGSRDVLQAIVSEYERSGKHADGFDVVAVLAALPESPRLDQARAQTLLNIRMTRETKDTRKKPSE